jgi:hypothetical protein
VGGLYGLGFAASNVFGGTFPAPSSPAALQCFQRTSTTGGAGGLGAGTIAITINPSVPLRATEWRLIDAITPTTVYSDWTELGAKASGSQVLNFAVPVRLAQYKIQLRPDRDNALIATSNAFMIGEVIGLMGQSLAYRCYTSLDTTYYLNTVDGSHALIGAGGAHAGKTLGLTPSPFAPLYGSLGTGGVYPTPTWGLSSDGGTYTGSFLPEFGRLFMAEYGCPVAVIGASEGGTAITSWVPGGAGNTAFKAAVTAATGGVGGLGRLIYWQGHSDTGLSPLLWKDSLRLLIADMKATFSAVNFKVFVSAIPNIESTAWGTTAGIQNIRQAAEAYVNDQNAIAPNSTAYVQQLDLHEGDGVHPSGYGIRTVARAFWRADMKLAGLDDHGNDGPLLVSGTRSGAVITMTVSHAGGTALEVWSTVPPALPVQLTGGAETAAIDQFRIYPAPYVAVSNQPPATALTISSFAITDDTHFTITLSSPPADDVALSVRYRAAPDGSSTADVRYQTGIYDDNTADGIVPGRQLRMGVAAEILVPAPLTLTVTTISNVANGAAISVAGTYTGTAPSSINYALNNGSYAAASAAIGSGAFSFTIAAGTADGYYRVAVQNADSTAVVGYSNWFWVGTVPAFNPMAMVTASGTAAPVMWLDASDPVYKDVWGTQVAAPTDLVYRWKDKSGNGNDIAGKFSPAAFNTLVPTLVADGINGRPGVKFITSPASQLFALLEATWMKFLDSSALTVVACYKPVTLTGNQNLFSMTTSGSNTMILFATASSRVQWNRNIGNVAPTPTLVAGTTTKIVMRYNPVATATSKGSVVVGGAAAVEGSTNTSSPGAGGQFTTFAMPGSNSTTMVLCEFIIYAATATDAERTAAHAYLTAKWGN